MNAAADTARGDRLDVWVALIESYEAQHWAMDPPDPIDAIGGTIAQLLVCPGAHVTRSQALLRLDPYPFDFAVRAAQATADEAE